MRQATISTDNWAEQARQLYEQTVFGGDAGVLAEADRQLDAVEADYSLARGRIMHAQFLLVRDQHPDQATGDDRELALFERAAQIYRAFGDVSGEAESLFWIGCFHQVIGHDNARAIPALKRSLELGLQAGERQTASEALRHLGIAAFTAGQLDAAQQHLEESTRLRREIGLLPGVATNLIGLAYIAAAQDRRDDAQALLDEACVIAEGHAAERVLRTISEARAELSPPG